MDIVACVGVWGVWGVKLDLISDRHICVPCESGGECVCVYVCVCACVCGRVSQGASVCVYVCICIYAVCVASVNLHHIISTIAPSRAGSEPDRLGPHRPLLPVPGVQVLRHP